MFFAQFPYVFYWFLYDDGLRHERVKRAIFWGPRADEMGAEGRAVFIIFKGLSMKQVKWIFFGRLESDLKNTCFEKHL